MEKVLVRGRWESSRTARIYSTDGIGQLLRVRLPTTVRRRLRVFARAWMCRALALLAGVWR
eukprot:2215330-Lingulodinium_polyedra.AAC.1